MFATPRRQGARSPARRHAFLLPTAAGAVFAALACTSDAPTRPVLAATTPESARSGRRPAAPPLGGLRCGCTQAGGGVTAAPSCAARTTPVDEVPAATGGAGSCLPAGLPRAGSPRRKGPSQNPPPAGSRLVPGATTLHGGGAALSSA